jgi:hypothetical protein
MTTQTKLTWCAMLAKLVAPMEPERAAKAFADMLPLLPADDDRYTRSALERAAKIDRKTAVPTFEDLSRAFSEEWKANLPAAVRLGANPETPRLDAPARVPPSAEECDHVRNLVTAFKADVAKVSEAKGVDAVVHDIPPAPLSKLQLARAATPAVLAMRPDLRAALRNAAQGEAEEAA